MLILVELGDFTLDFIDENAVLSTSLVAHIHVLLNQGRLLLLYVVPHGVHYCLEEHRRIVIFVRL